MFNLDNTQLLLDNPKKNKKKTPHQDRDDAFELLLYKITNNLVIEILNRLPLQTE